MKLYLKELACYESVPKERQHYKNFYYPDKYFDLDALPTEGLRNEFGCFIYKRGKTKTVQSIYLDLRHFSHTASFLSNYYPQLESLECVKMDDCIHKMKQYLTDHGMALTLQSGADNPSITYLRNAIAYYEPKHRIYFKDLNCYQNVSIKKQSSARYEPESFFDLARLPTNEILRNEFSTYIHARGSKLAFTSMNSEKRCFHLFSDFLSAYYPSIQSIKEIDKADLEKKLRRWFLKNNMPMRYEHHKRSTGGTEVVEHQLFGYIRALLQYFSDDDGLFHFEDDIWELNRLDISLRLPLTGAINTCNFSNIPIPDIKKTVKEVALCRFKEAAVRTVIAEIHAITKFSEFLAEYFTDVISLLQIDRELIEAYLTYIYTDGDRKKSYRTELMHLKTVLHTAGKILEEHSLSHVFLSTDFDRQILGVFHFYTDSEVIRLNNGFRTLPPQIGRAMILHEILGLRISDTLTLKSDCIFVTPNGAHFIRINQPKVNRTFEKPISKEVETLINSAISYTTTNYGACEYVFVCDRDPQKPMQYSNVQYHLMCMIHDLDLRDDNGNLFTVGTHTLRHVYGKRLCDMGLDDATISALLGHKDTASVKHYRQMGNKALAQGTKALRDAKDAKIKQFKEEW